jgi:hypothetical protein
MVLPFCKRYPLELGSIGPSTPVAYAMSAVGPGFHHAGGNV